MQLELFPEPLEQRTERRLDEMKQSQDRVRKALFQENNILKKELRELRSEVELLKANICKGLLL